VEALDDGAWVNVGFFNPHLSASMYKWGDTKTGVQNAMDAHRLAAHHLGNPETPVDWIERAANFVIHHIPREHWGIRHEPRGEYSDLESKMAQDPTMKDSEIGKAIARDVAALCQLLEAEGKIVPWGQLAVPQDALPPTLIEHAFLVQRAGPPLDQNDPHYSEALKQLESARAIISRVPEAIAKAASEGRADLAAAYKRMLGDG
jgi:hypothetical protein